AAPERAGITAFRGIRALRPARQVSSIVPRSGGQRMSAVLRAYGADFDVDRFLAGCTLPLCAVKRRGEPGFAARQPDGRRHERSGVHVSASDADFEEFPRQVEEATAFLRAEVEQVRRLCKFPGVEDVTLDFGIDRRGVAVQCDYLPPELVRLAGALGLGIELSQYRARDAAPGAEPRRCT